MRLFDRLDRIAADFMDGPLFALFPLFLGAVFGFTYDMALYLWS